MTKMIKATIEIMIDPNEYSDPERTSNVDGFARGLLRNVLDEEIREFFKGIRVTDIREVDKAEENRWRNYGHHSQDWIEEEP